MTEQLYFVEIFKRGQATYKKAVKRVGPMPYRNATKVHLAVEAEVDFNIYGVRTVKSRADYFQDYHQQRYWNEPEYKKRKQDNARAWAKRTRAAARGDLTPWLQD